MNIALCLSGHMRKYEETYDAWKKNFIDIYKPHIYIHTWSNRGNFVSKPNDLVLGANQVGTVQEHDDKINVKEIRSLFHPHNIVVEEYENLRDTFTQWAEPMCQWRDSLSGWGYTRPHDFISFSYKIWKCNELRKQLGFKYEFIVRSRADVVPTQPIPEYVFNTHNTMFCPMGHPNSWPVYYESNVQSVVQELLISDSWTMDKYADLFTRMPEMYKRAREMNHPERILNQHTATYWYFQDYGIKHEFVPLKYRLHR